MCFHRPVFAALGLLLLAGCRDREVRAYQVPREEPASPPGMAAAPGPGARAHPVALSWSAPAQWEQKPAGGFRRGSFTLRGEGGAEADFSIIAFPGDAGGLRENLNRWRGQIDLPPLTQAELDRVIEHVDGRAGLHFDVVDFSGTAGGAPTRILGAVLHHGGESWFFKVMGPETVVAAEKPAFLEFLQTVSPAAQ